MLIVATIVLACVYLLINTALTLMRNHKAHKFFQIKSPQLPVVPNPGIFDGHGFRIINPKKNWKIIEDLHDKYGNTFGYYMIEQPWVSTKDVDLIKLIEIDEGHKHVNRNHFGMSYKAFDNSIFQLEDDEWRQQRRIVASTMNNHKVKYGDINTDIETIVTQLAASLQRRAEKARKTGGSPSFIIEVREFFERYSLAVLLLIDYKKDNVINFDADRDKLSHEFNVAGDCITNPLALLSMGGPPLRPLLRFLLQFSTTGRKETEILGYVKEAADSNRKAREKYAKQKGGGNAHPYAELPVDYKRSLADNLIEGFLEKKIGYKYLEGNLLFLFMASFKTSADASASLFWQLAVQPEIQEKLRQTIITEGIDADYVMWCINESLRIHPPVPLGVGRLLADDVEVNGLRLAKGTFVMPSIHAVHHDPEIWPEPERFNPERWRDRSSFHPAAFLGFGLGPRNCPGGKLAIQLIKLLLRRVLVEYKIETCAETPTKLSFSSPILLFTQDDHPVRVKFSPLVSEMPQGC